MNKTQAILLNAATHKGNISVIFGFKGRARFGTREINAANALVAAGKLRRGPVVRTVSCKHGGTPETVSECYFTVAW